MKLGFRGPVTGLSSNLLIVGGYTLIYFNMVANKHQSSTNNIFHLLLNLFEKVSELNFTYRAGDSVQCAELPTLFL